MMAGKSRRLLCVAALLMIGVAGVSVRVWKNGAEKEGRDEDTPKTIEKKAVAAQAKPDERFERLPDGRSLYIPSVNMAKALNTAADPQEDLDMIESMFDQYKWAYKFLPEGGENRELVAALTGQNPKKVIFLQPGSVPMSAEGELLDRWGTPYHFHKISDQILDIVSAGPDRRLWSNDDLSLGHTEEYESSIDS
jgi:hypothetical protein